MNFTFFKSLTIEESKKFFDDFIGFGMSKGLDVISQIIHFTVNIDFSMDTLPVILQTLSANLKTIPREENKELPEWIRGTDSYQKKLFDFDDSSKTIVLASAYILLRHL